MASTIAAITTGTGGVVTTADATGNLNLLSGTTTVLSVASTGATVSGTLGINGSTSGTATIVTPAAAGTPTLTLPTTTGTLPLVSQLRSYLAGLTLSTAGSSATMSIAAGVCNDSTNVSMMALAATSKTTSAWALGAAVGGLDTGTIANSTWYYYYVIQRADTGVVDCVFSTSASLPTLPTNYTLYRYIGAGLTNGSAQWVAFIQDGDLFQWNVSVADISAANPGTAAVTRTLTVPRIRCTSIVSVSCVNTTLNIFGGGILSDLSASDENPSTIFGSFSEAVGGAATCNTIGTNEVLTNTSAQIRSRIGFSDSGTTLTIKTRGWRDTRGRNA